MSANVPPNRPLPLATRARLAAAASASVPQLRSTLYASQPVPTRSDAPQGVQTCSNAFQPARSEHSPAQNEATRPLSHGLSEVLAQTRALRAAMEDATPDPFQPVPNRSNASHPTPRRKTNPLPAPSSILHPPSSPSKRARPLTPAQLRAARLWVAGHTPAAIAQALAVSTHTFARWKRRPDFQAELRRLLDHTAPGTSTVA